jgi:hypothetical protein
MSQSPANQARWRWFAIAMTVLFIISLILMGREIDVGTFLGVLITLVSLNGVYGYGWQRPLLRRWVWQILAVFQTFVFASAVFGFLTFMFSGVQGRAAVILRLAPCPYHAHRACCVGPLSLRL